MKRFTLPIVLLCVLVALQAAKYGNRYYTGGGGGVLPPPVAADMVVAIAESNNRPVWQTDVVMGPTAKRLIKAHKWRCYDPNQLPADTKDVLQSIIDKYKTPNLSFFRGKTPLESMTLPKTDAELKALVEKRGL